MRTDELNFEYPQRLVATEPSAGYRILKGGEHPSEITKAELFALFQPGDVLVVNNTKVLKRRVFADRGLEILFLKPVGDREWEVLFPAREIKDSDVLTLPGDVSATLVRRALPQVIRVSKDLDEAYFGRHGELALPPYIQAARGDRRNRDLDQEWYQTAWAEQAGSVAAPTASLHFTLGDLAHLKQLGVRVDYVTLHVGIGTFLPVKAAKLDEHVMHKEYAEVPAQTAASLVTARRDGKRVWALGTTVVRTLESWAHGRLVADPSGAARGETDLFIRPGFRFEAVDALLTNFHQPKSTLLALVSAFAGLENVRRAYQYAIAEEFRLFSYGDLTVWIKKN